MVSRNRKSDGPDSCPDAFELAGMLRQEPSDSSRQQLAVCLGESRRSTLSVDGCLSGPPRGLQFGTSLHYDGRAYRLAVGETLSTMTV